MCSWQTWGPALHPGLLVEPKHPRSRRRWHQCKQLMEGWSKGDKGLAEKPDVVLKPQKPSDMRKSKLIWLLSAKVFWVVQSSQRTRVRSNGTIQPSQETIGVLDVSRKREFLHHLCLLSVDFHSSRGNHLAKKCHWVSEELALLHDESKVQLS